MLANLDTETKQVMYIGPGTIQVTDIKLNEDKPYSENQYNQKNEARIDVHYNMQFNNETVIKNKFFSFYISEETFVSKSGKTKYLTDKGQFYWAVDEAEAKLGKEMEFRQNDGSMKPYTIVHPSETVYPAYRKLEPFVAFIQAMLRFNPKKGSPGDFWEMLGFEHLFSNQEAFSEKMKTFVDEFKDNSDYNQVRVLFIIDDKGRSRIDTKNKESFGFGGSNDTKALEKAIKAQSQTQWPYVSGTLSLTFQEFNPANAGLYASEMMEITGISDEGVDEDEWDL